MSCCCQNNEDKKTSCCSKKKPSANKWIIVLIVLIIAGLIIYSKQSSKNNIETSPTKELSMNGLPTLIELGAEKCTPCKIMKPIIDDLQTNYKKSLNVSFFDVWANPEMGEKFKIQIIPVQIFLDKTGKEIFRHEGFFSKEDILSKWKELGYEINN